MSEVVSAGWRLQHSKELCLWLTEDALLSWPFVSPTIRSTDGQGVQANGRSPDGSLLKRALKNHYANCLD